MIYLRLGVNIMFDLINNIPNRPFVGLFGTCNDSNWRNELIPQLKVPFFNPVITDGSWNESCRQVEEQAKSRAHILLYVITPEMIGIYSIAELVISACKSTRSTDIVVVFLEKYGSKEFTNEQSKSIAATKALLRQTTTAIILESLQVTADFINKRINWWENK